MAMLFVSCSKHSKVKLYEVEKFNTTINGKQVSLVTLDNGDLMMQVTNYGGRVVSLWAPGRKGKYANVIASHDNINDYINDGLLGATVGRYASVISNGKITIDGTDYELTKNHNGNTVNGGDTEAGKIVWDIVAQNDTAVVFHAVFADGQDGFPGNLDATMTYTLTSANEFVVSCKATTDAPTVCDITQHLSFNLKGDGDILDHDMMINGKFFTAIKSDRLPSGNIRPVKNSPLDFIAAKKVGKDINSDFPQMQFAGGYDFNYVLGKPFGKIGLAASVVEPVSGRKMEVYTDQPGLQFSACATSTSFVLEPQNFPDAPNQEKFPNAVLRPDEEYYHTCIYKFSVVD